MNEKRIEALKTNHAETSNQELLAIWNENDRENYTEEAFEAIKQVLQERGVPVPTQSEFIPKEDREPTILVKNAEDPLRLGLENKVIKYEIVGTSKGLGINSLSASHLYVGSQGLCLVINSEHAKPKNVFADWKTIRELSNTLKTNNSFLMNIGKGLEDLRFKIKIVDGNPLQLSEFLEKLPDITKCGKCPKCAGLVRNEVCESCGEKLTTSLRERGFRLICLGVATTIIGLFLCIFAAHWFESVNSPIWLIWYGPPFAGILLIFRGCYEALWRKKM